MDEPYGSDLHLAKLLPEFSRLQATIGRKLRDTDSWAPWARLVSLHGWKRLLRAVEQCAPNERWPNVAETFCQQYAKDEATVLAPAPAPRPPMDNKAAARQFASIRTKYGV